VSALQLSPSLIDILVCPATRQPLRLSPSGTGLISDAAGLIYPIRDGVPVLVIEQAIPIDEGPS